ncbi:MAG TPA: glycosyltransferase family 39 protein [Candidatus Omnitrophota bacterium]|nr:glycosyltransferase family 39 protein [Candidatus Omnitrophota bacterium]HPS36991.1 glycosyltransferase family 39 protein [Candidatus Omnitrophota bacterium]
MFLNAVKNGVFFRTLLILYFAYLLLSRVAYLNADLPLWEFNIEEKATAYNARNMVLFGDASSGGRDYEPRVSSPLPYLLSCLSFLLMGVSLVSLRLPYALLSVAAIFLFYKVLRKETNPWFALLGTVLLGSSQFVVALNRSAVAENLFILLMAAAFYFFRNFVENKKTIFAFLFGLFAALNLSVKYSGIHFLLVCGTGILLYALAERKNPSAAGRPVLLFTAGSALSLILPGAALLWGRGNGALKTIGWLCKDNLAFDHETFLHNLNFELPLFFLRLFPFVLLIALTGLFLIVLFRLRPLSKTDAFALLWLTLGIVSSLFGFLYYKRLIFLILPVVYLAVKTAYGMWRYLKEPDPPQEGKIGGWRGETIRTAGLTALWWGFSLLIAPSVLFVLTFYFGAHNGKILHATMLAAYMLLPVTNLVCQWIASRNFSRFTASDLKRWLVGGGFCFFIAASVFSLAANEINDTNIFLNPKNLAFQSFENSRDLGKILGPNTTVIGSEMAFRILGFDNKCKFLFNHDGSIDPFAAYKKDVADILSAKDPRYFCLILDYKLGLSALVEFQLSMEKINRHYPRLRLVKTYPFMNSSLFLFDKYGRP